MEVIKKRIANILAVNIILFTSVIKRHSYILPLTFNLKILKFIFNFFNSVIEIIFVFRS